MDDRKKLIKLLEDAPTDPIGNRNVGVIADHLLAHGVTVQKTGRWISRDSCIWGCSCCRKLSVFTHDYCPRCGAKMEV